MRLAGTRDQDIENLAGWLTTVTARICLNMLRTRKARREDALGPYVPEPIVSGVGGVDPEHEALLGDSVGLALQVVLETLTPGERLAYVLHDMFGVAFEEIAALVERKRGARKLASRARARVGATPIGPDADPGRQRESSTRSAPPPATAASRPCRRPRPRHRAALRRRAAATGRHRAGRGGRRRGIEGDDLREPRALGAPGAGERRRGRGGSAARRGLLGDGFTVRGGRAAAIDALADPERLAGIDITRSSAPAPP